MYPHDKLEQNRGGTAEKKFFLYTEWTSCTERAIVYISPLDLYRNRADCTETGNFWKSVNRNRMYRTRLVPNWMYITS